jgi:hypothetical protein
MRLKYDRSLGAKVKKSLPWGSIKEFGSPFYSDEVVNKDTTAEGKKK